MLKKDTWDLGSTEIRARIYNRDVDKLILK
jgi:hypothetical protein